MSGDGLDAADCSIAGGQKKLLIVGGVGGTNVGESLYRAALKMGMQAKILDTRSAFSAPAWLRAINWRLLSRRPVHLHGFGRELLRTCETFRPQVLITTGLAPVSRHVLDKIGQLGIRRLNFLTDDPWNPAHRAQWFMRALPAYDVVYSPRRAMLSDLESAGCKQVRFLPFGYDEDLFFTPGEEARRLAAIPVSDVVFAGGADEDRVPYMQALIKQGFDLALYGDYWHRQPATRQIAKGLANVETLRLAVASAKVALCLVRRANRDGSCMRTFEVPAVGACMLTEDTPEHREIFGNEGEAVLYFDSLETMLEKTRRLCDDEALRTRLAKSVHRLITTGGHTYRHRLAAMLAERGGKMPVTEHPLRIDIVVHGRFHAFHLARALLARGHDVRLLTNYPKHIVSRFGIPPQRVKSCLWHGLATSLYYRLHKKMGLPDCEPWLHHKFGRWAAKQVRRDGDALYLFSGVAEETLRALDTSYSGIKLVVRASAHIQAQRSLLADEETRCGVPVDKPSDWIVAREEREYTLADHIVVLSSFARDSFLKQGFDTNKILLLLSGVDASRFAPERGVLESRAERVRSGETLRVLIVGTFSPRKGALDLIEIAKAMSGRMQFRFVGDVPDESASLYRKAQGLIEFIPRLPEFELPQHYAWGDVFCFPTIEDGYPAVLAQALTASLPALTTPNCSAPDIVRDEMNGWILPIRSPESFISRLDWCDKNREALAKMIENMRQISLARDWTQVAAHFETLVSDALGRRK